MTQLSVMKSNNSIWTLHNEEETIAFGQKLTENFPQINLLLLKGNLGAGKTTLVKGIALGLGITEPITSPTFALSQHYPNGSKPLVHLDLYRLEEQEAADELFLQEEETVKATKALMIVEWPERLSLAINDAWVISIKIKVNGARIIQIERPSG